jgi:hypothetical protein
MSQTMFDWRQTPRKSAFIRSCFMHAGAWCGLSLLSLWMSWRLAALVAVSSAIFYGVLMLLGYGARDRKEVV